MDPKWWWGGGTHPLKPYLAIAYARRLQAAACQSLRLDDNTLAWSVEAFLEAMAGAFTPPRDGILNFPESDAHTEPLEMHSPLKDVFPAFQDLFWTPDEDPLGGILVMHKVWTEYQVTIHLHDLPVGMMSRKGQIGKLQLESFEGVAICSIEGALECTVTGVLALITGRSFNLHIHDQPISDPIDMGCPSLSTASSPPTVPTAPLPHDSPMDIGPPPPNLPEPLILIPLPMSPVTKEEQALLDGTSHLSIWEEEEDDSKEEDEDPSDVFYKCWQSTW